ncbi:hypothetical protein [Mesorhizobium sp.]|uniref:hypothetical protein n=1 Tax=Mesorhizobium sp. TaxID=1871066 RepID=UPI00120F2FD6|nr:hypothetical protein [Mesorhizobium sp.]TIL64487.1 MAG: hypothetical protein E5Y77_26235 [Mesorhizobium sp.]
MTTPDNDNARFRGGLPSLKWLHGKAPEAAKAIAAEIRNARHQAHTDAAPSFLNPISATPDDVEVHTVPDEAVTSETMAETVQDGPDEVWQEVLHEIRPTERDICRALGWIEWPYTGRSAPIGWSMRDGAGKLARPDGRHTLPAYDGTRAHLAGMMFATGKGACKQRDGLLVSYQDVNGVDQRPSYRANKPRGGKRPHRTKAAIAAYIAMPAAVASPLRAEGYQRPMSGAPALIPTLTPLLRKAPDAWDKHGRYGVAEARRELQMLMVTAPPVTVCPVTAASRIAVDDTDERLAHFHATGAFLPRNRPLAPIARGARFIAGISSSKQTASVSAPNWQEPEGKPLSRILEEVASRGTLTDIGEAVRDKSKPVPARLDRLGKRALLAEAQSLVPVNDNSKKKLAA